MFSTLVAEATIFFSLFKILQPDLLNFVVLPASDAFNTLSKLYDSFGTSSLHVCVLLHGKIVPSAGPS